MSGPDAPQADARRPDEPGRVALKKIDEILAKRPRKDDYVISDATEALCDFRDRLTAAGVETASDRDRLERLNGVLAVVLGTHFPLGETPWDELAKARGWLHDLLTG